MNKKQYAFYRQLEKDLEVSAMEVYKWYSDNIEKLSYLQVAFNYIEKDKLWFDVKEGFNGCSEWAAKTLPLELLFFNDVERKEYSDKYHQDKAEKFKADRQEAQEQLQLARQLARAERYETYLELKEEFEDGEK